MKLTIEVSSQSELEQIILFFQTLKLESVRVMTDAFVQKPKRSNKKMPKITKGDKSIDPTELFGIWADNPRSVETIRQQAWKRDQIS